MKKKKAMTAPVDEDNFMYGCAMVFIFAVGIALTCYGVFGTEEVRCTKCGMHGTCNHAYMMFRRPCDVCGGELVNDD